MQDAPMPAESLPEPPPPSKGWGGGKRALLGCGGVLLLILVAGLLLPALGRTQEAARRTSCVGSNARQIGLAMFQYAGEYGDMFPPAIDPDDPNEPAQYRFAYLMKYGYINGTKVFICPSSRPRARQNRADLVDEKGQPTGALEMASLDSLAKMLLRDDVCSYGVDPEANHYDGTTRAVLADRPDPRYWGTGVNSPPSGSGSNSDNHRGKGQNVFYNDGHARWSNTVRDDANVDPNIYATNPGVDPKDDANIDFGHKPRP